MRLKKIIAMVMTFLMMLSLLPTLVFAAAAPEGELGGKLKIKGTAAVGSELSADYSKATPEGLSDEYVSFSWSRKVGDQITEVGTEKTYKLTEEDLGNKIQLKITGLSEMGVTGELKANTVEIVATPEEAPEDPTEDPDKTAEEEMQEMEEMPAADGEEDVIDIGGEDSSNAPAADIPEATDDSVSADTDAADIPEATGDSDMENAEGESVASDEESTTNDSVIDIGKEDYLEIPETGQTEEINNPEEESTTSEETAGSAEELTYTAEAVIEDGSAALDFGSLEEGFENPEAKEVTIKNTGTGTLTFQEISPEHFMVQDLATLEPGESQTVWVMPRVGTASGEYKDTITYTTEEGATASFEADLVVTAQADDGFADTPKEPEVSESSDGLNNPDDAIEPATNSPVIETVEGTNQIDFGTFTVGQQPEAKSITLRNSGTGTVNLKTDRDSYTYIGASLSGTELPADGTTVTLSAQPKVVDQTGVYSELVQVLNADTNDVLYEISVNYTVKEADNPVLAADKTSVDFGSTKEGYTQVPDAAVITLTNQGNVTLSNISVTTDGSNFAAGDPAAASLEAGQSTTFTITPVAGLKMGSYTQNFTVTSDQTSAITIAAAFIVKEADNPSLTADNTNVDFGSREEGYIDTPGAVTVTLSNQGNVTLANISAATDGGAFTVANLTATALDPGQTATFTVVPAAGLKAGNYTQTIAVTSDKTAAFSIAVTFTVTEVSTKLTGVGKVADITVANGVEKSVDGLKLPSTVKITTNKGEMKASVKWDVKGCAYNQSSSDSQSFSVKGSVVLPDGVTNPSNLSLVISANVTVSRGSIVSDAANNTITGISSDGAYTTETKITFTAVGAGMDIANPIKGDIRYQPLNWEVLESRSWDGAPYSATFRMGKSGNYTLTVTYNQQKFDGSNWVNTGTQDTKQVNFNISASPNQTLTPAANRADQKNAVKTGDNTPILPFVIVLVVAVILIVGILVYRNKKNK